MSDDQADAARYIGVGDLHTGTPVARLVESQRRNHRHDACYRKLADERLIDPCHSADLPQIDGQAVTARQEQAFAEQALQGVAQPDGPAAREFRRKIVADHVP